MFKAVHPSDELPTLPAQEEDSTFARSKTAEGSTTSMVHDSDKNRLAGADDIMLGFQNLSISSVDPPKHIISNVSGFVVKGGITAVLGPSSGGKSVLMKVLTGRLPTVHYTGEVTFCGKPINPHSQRNGFGFVPQEDTLIGDLTVRETFQIAARLRNTGTLEEAAQHSDEVIQGLGLQKVCDNVVGTVLKRGLSGGEKRRTSVGQELVVSQALAFLDEPTSGLDGTAAYDVIKTIKDFTRRSDGGFSVMLSIHQPNQRILELFDHMLLLGRGGSLFFGTLSEAIGHFVDIGHPPPRGQVPTDFFMQVTDDSFAVSTLGHTRFRQAYATSDICTRVVQRLEVSKAMMLERMAKGGKEYTFSRPGFATQVSTLLWRDAVVALRDPTLYYLQVILHIIYGFMIGATFWNTPTTLDDRGGQLASSCVWLVMIQSYIHIFKVFYLVNSNRRFASERANLSYGVVSFFLAELVVTSLAQLLWIPGCTIAFFMIGMPSDAYLFCMLALYVAALSAEGMINLVTKCTNDTSIGIVVSEAFLVILTVFAGGVFRPFDEIPSYWTWVQALSLFTHSSKAFLLAVFEEVLFDCPTANIIDSIGASGEITGFCVTLQHTYECDAGYTADTAFCQVEGTTVVDTNAGGLEGSKWEFLGHNLALLLMFRVGVFFFLRWPKESIFTAIKAKLSSSLVNTSLAQTTEIQMLWGEVEKLKKASRQGDPQPYVHPASEPNAPSERGGDDNDDSNDESDGMSPAVDQASSLPAGDKEREHSKALVFRDIQLVLPKSGKVLVDNVTGKATAGRVLALMGPSGAGKTTLLNALSGRATYAKVTGSLTLAGRALASDDLNYVPQFDDLNEAFSSRELLTHMRLLKVRADPEATRQSVTELLHILGLGLKADLRVSALSGGEQKRLSIGLGMVSEPEVLFLDEPTTGLASAAAFSVVGYISKLAAQTKVVCIMTIHQPASEIFDMLGDLMLLEGGRLAYFGTTTRARLFFDSLAPGCPAEVNPADYYLDLISQPPATTTVGDGVMWKDLYYKSEFNIAIMAAATPTGTTSHEEHGGRPAWSSRVLTLVKTLLTYYWRTTEVHWLRVLELAVLALFVGTMFLRLDNSKIAEMAGASFFNIWIILCVVVASVPAFDRDRRIALQEMLNGAYGPALLCVSQFVASAPYIFVTAFIYQSIFHWLVGFNDSVSAYSYAVILSASLLFMMEAIMLMVVEALKNAMLSCTFSIVVLGMLFLFTGFFIKPDDMAWPVQWVTFIIPTRYAFDGYLFSIFHGQEYSTSIGTVTGDQILQSEFAQSSSVNQWVNLAIMSAWVIWLRLAHFCMIYRGILPYRNAMAVPASSVKA